MTQATPDQPPLLFDLSRPVAVGGGIIAIFFGLLVGWAMLADLASAALAPGEVASDSNRKTIQHLEGGIVEQIFVREGSEVIAGEPLLKLSITQPQALLEQLGARLQAARAREARLLAERDGLEKIAFPPDLSTRQGFAKVSEVLKGEQNIFAARQASLKSQEAILRQRIAQYQEEVEGLQGEVRSADKQLEILQDEISSMEGLVDRKLVGKQRLFELQREFADISGERSRDLSSIARANQNIAEQELQILELVSQQTNEIVNELREVQTTIYQLQEQQLAARDVLNRTQVIAPIAGTVVGLQVHTVGGVIASRQTLMEIVPSDDKLIINARLSPQDIDVVASGLPAKIRLLAFNQRDMQPLDGTVVMVSADRLQDERTGQPYYLARVELPEEPSAHAPDLRIQPGMEAEVMIITGQRTTLDYLLEPLTRSLRRSFREQ